MSHFVFFSFFFLQQFIIQSIWVDHSSYFVTTYKRNRHTWNKNRERKRKQKRKKEKKKKKQENIKIYTKILEKANVPRLVSKNMTK